MVMLVIQLNEYIIYLKIYSSSDVMVTEPLSMFDYEILKDFLFACGIYLFVFFLVLHVI